MRLVRVGETWRRIFDKVVLKVTGQEATMGCQYDQMCAGLKAVIDVTVHSVQAIWGEKSTTEDWGFLLVDAKKRVQKDQSNQNYVESLSFVAIWSSLCL